MSGGSSGNADALALAPGLGGALGVTAAPEGAIDDDEVGEEPLVGDGSEATVDAGPTTAVDGVVGPQLATSDIATSAAAAVDHDRPARTPTCLALRDGPDRPPALRACSCCTRCRRRTP